MIRPEEHKIKCNYIDCAAGMGQARYGRCFLGGIYWHNNCPAFVDEDEMLKEWENANRLQNIP